MSKLVPQRTIDALRSFNDISVDMYGIKCFLYVVNNSTSIASNGVYNTPTDLNYDVRDTRVFINWNPDARMLRKLGLFVEGELPIICYFDNEQDIPIGSYIKVDTQYIPRKYDRDEFEIVDSLIKGMYDAVVLRAYKLAPRRVKKDVSLI